LFNIGNIQFNDFPLFLAPMEDVSDPPFRYLCKQYGADMMYTEFISSEGLIRDAKKSLKKLELFGYERPIGIQLFGNNIHSMIEAAKIAEEAKPDLIDINFGCPVKKVALKGAGAGMLQDIPKMIKMTAAIVKAVNLPVTVKTRLGWDENSKDIVEIAERLQDAGIKALAIHGRTRVQMYKGSADWTLIGAVKNNSKIKIPIIGNGDINSPEAAKEKFERYGVDGIMIGRYCIGKPWLFKSIKNYLEKGEIIPEPGLEEKTKIAVMHLKKSIEWKGLPTGIYEIRRHLSNYFKGLPNFKEIRMKLVTTNDEETLTKLLLEIPKMYPEY